MKELKIIAEHIEKLEAQVASLQRRNRSNLREVLFSVGSLNIYPDHLLDDVEIYENRSSKSFIFRIGKEKGKRFDIVKFDAYITAKIDEERKRT